MGCGLRKLKPSEENSPGKIYSTLKRPQVETKVGVAYTYRYLDFLIGKDDGTSTLRLSSVRELPSQLQDLYQQGFLLAAVHPFIHPCGPASSSSSQHQLYRAVLVRLNDGSEKSQTLPAAPPRLRLEECLSADQVPTPELIQGYVKKQIQDAADQGVMFVGFIQEPRGAPGSKIHREPETPSLSLHSSPSSVLGSLGSCGPFTPQNHGEPVPLAQAIDTGAEEGPEHEAEAESLTGKAGESGGTGLENNHDGGSSKAASHSWEEIEQDTLTQNNNKTNATEQRERPSHNTRRTNGAELLALFNHPTVRENQLKYYTVKVPLRVQLRDQEVKGVEANWLDHMTHHFNNGASLVDGYFHLSNDNDVLTKSVDSVFIFQEGTEGDSSTSAATTTYDAIVVEQWTVIDGLQVKTDYVPLLQSLAMYGWRLTCVLPTPIIKSNSDGSLSTKQIVFLQRPVLPRKRRESKKLTFKNRSKSNKNSVKDEPKSKKKKNKPSATEIELEDAKIAEDGDKCVKEEGRSSKDGEEQKEEGGGTAEVEMEGKETEEPGEEEGEGKDGELEAEDGGESGVETGEERDASAGTEEIGGVVEKRAGEKAKGGVKTEQEREEEKETGGRVENDKTTEFGEGGMGTDEVKENGIETEEEREGGGESRESDHVAAQRDKPKHGKSTAQEEVPQEADDDGQVTLTNQSPEKPVGSEE